MVLILNLLVILKSPLCYPAGTDFQRLFSGLGVRTGDCLPWVGLARCLHSPGAPRQGREPLAVSSVPVTCGRGSRVTQIPALRSFKLPICGTWESPGTVGMGQERCGTLSVPLLLATECSCYQQCVLCSPEGLGLGIP